jgi:hypothetical protein
MAPFTRHCEPLYALVELKQRDQRRESCVVGKRACAFKKNDVKRAIDAARSKQIEVNGLRVTNHVDGSTSIEIIAAKPGEASGPADASEWDVEQ